MKQRKSFLKIATLVFAIGLLGVFSCQKEKRKPASLIEGEYEGSGTTASQDPFISQKIRIVELSNKKIRVEPVGNSVIAPFEMEVMYVKDKVTSKGNSAGDLGATIDGSSVSLGFSSPSGETFAGFKL